MAAAVTRPKNDICLCFPVVVIGMRFVRDHTVRPLVRIYLIILLRERTSKVK